MIRQGDAFGYYSLLNLGVNFNVVTSARINSSLHFSNKAYIPKYLGMYVYN